MSQEKPHNSKTVSSAHVSVSKTLSQGCTHGLTKTYGPRAHVEEGTVSPKMYLSTEIRTCRPAAGHEAPDEGLREVDGHKANLYEA